MSLNRTELVALRQEAEDRFRKAEDEYRRDLEAIDRLLDRFCDPAPISPASQSINPLIRLQPILARPTELEARIRDVMTRGNGASPWAAPTLYSFIEKDYKFPQQRDGAVNSILSILKGWAARGIVHEQKGRGRRPSQFTWNEAIYPKGPTNGGVHYAPIGVLPSQNEEEKEATEVAAS